MTNQPIIIGAGVSGLIAAIELEKAGGSPLIVEQTDRVGGRVKTDFIQDIPLDHGFQVLLTEYPEAQRYLDYEALDLVKFVPGSLIFEDGHSQKIGDAFRNLSLLWPTVKASAGSIGDKLKVLQLSRSLQQKTIDDIFAAPEKTTRQYLTDYGFSDAIIRNFFSPFFSGIFLETELATSSRMFEFVYKMFGTGYAAIPRKGMQAIPDQLRGKLKRTTFLFDTKVKTIKDGSVFFDNGDARAYTEVIVATAPQSILDLPSIEPVRWKSCHNLYFKVDGHSLGEPIIGLLPAENTLVNNFHFLTDVFGKKIADTSILSVTTVGSSSLAPSTLINRVRTELQKHCGINAGALLHQFHIKKALPNLSSAQYQPDLPILKGMPNVFLCGDHTANGSLNAAMASGRIAAEAVLEGWKRLA